MGKARRVPLARRKGHLIGDSMAGIHRCLGSKVLFQRRDEGDNVGHPSRAKRSGRHATSCHRSRSRGRCRCISSRRCGNCCAGLFPPTLPQPRGDSASDSSGAIVEDVRARSYRILLSSSCERQRSVRRSRGSAIDERATPANGQASRPLGARAPGCVGATSSARERHTWSKCSACVRRACVRRAFDARTFGQPGSMPTDKSIERGPTRARRSSAFDLGARC